MKSKCRHDFSDEDLEYCAKGCGETRTSDLIKSLSKQLGDAEEIIQTLVYFTKKVCAESHEDLDLKRETLEKAKQFLER